MIFPSKHIEITGCGLPAPGQRERRDVHHLGRRDRHRPPRGLGEGIQGNCCAVLSANMMAVRGRMQRAGDVVHLVAQRITDLSVDLASVGVATQRFRLCWLVSKTVMANGTGTRLGTEGYSQNVVASRRIKDRRLLYILRSVPQPLSGRSAACSGRMERRNSFLPVVFWLPHCSSYQSNWSAISRSGHLVRTSKPPHLS